MSFASKFNHGKKFNFEIPKEFKYASLSDLYNNNGAEHVYPVMALYFNHKSKYGENPVAVTTAELVNLPKHLNDVCKEIVADKEAVGAINNNQFGFKIRQYERNDKPCFSVEWVDL
jgi:hypothetical protein|nr:MAG TPA: putative single-stranded DNA-binding protein [Caudoviricetes sp.]